MRCTVIVESQYQEVTAYLGEYPRFSCGRGSNIYLSAIFRFERSTSFRNLIPYLSSMPNEQEQQIGMETKWPIIRYANP